MCTYHNPKYSPPTPASRPVINISTCGVGLTATAGTHLVTTTYPDATIIIFTGEKVYVEDIIPLRF